MSSKAVVSDSSDTTYVYTIFGRGGSELCSILRNHHINFGSYNFMSISQDIVVWERLCTMLFHYLVSGTRRCAPYVPPCRGEILARGVAILSATSISDTSLSMRHMWYVRMYIVLSLCVCEHRLSLIIVSLMALLCSHAAGLRSR